MLQKRFDGPLILRQIIACFAIWMLLFLAIDARSDVDEIAISAICEDRGVGVGLQCAGAATRIYPSDPPR